MYIKSSIENYKGTIIIDNPSKRNALSKELLTELTDIMEEFERQNLRVVIIRAERGVKIWSAGHDVNELSEQGRDPLSYNDPLEIAIRKISKFPGPVIAMVEGSVYGGACELVFTCDMIIGTPDVTLAITPAKLGVPYNPTGILHFLSMLEMGIVKEMFFTAAPIKAERAYDLGILNHIVESEKIESFTNEIAETIIKNSPLAIKVIKETLRLLSGAHSMTPETFEMIQGLRRSVYDSDDYKEGIKAFIEKRQPIFKGR